MPGTASRIPRTRPTRSSSRCSRRTPRASTLRQPGEVALMRLSELLHGLGREILGTGDPEVRGVAHDSRTVEPGDLYMALVGQRFDGREFAKDAVAKGAVAVAGPRPSVPQDPDVPWVVAEEPRRLLGPLAARTYGHPDRELTLAAVTGTNGKSTVATLLAAVLDAAGRPAGFIGTLGYRFGGRVFRAATPRPRRPTCSARCAA